MSVARLLHLTRNLPSKVFSSKFGAGILQTARTTSKCGTFWKISDNLISKISKQDGNITVTKGTLTKIHEVNK